MQITLSTNPNCAPAYGLLEKILFDMDTRKKKRKTGSLTEKEIEEMVNKAIELRAC